MNGDVEQNRLGWIANERACRSIIAMSGHKLPLLLNNRGYSHTGSVSVERIRIYSRCQRFSGSVITITPVSTPCLKDEASIILDDGKCPKFRMSKETCRVDR